MLRGSGRLGRIASASACTLAALFLFGASAAAAPGGVTAGSSCVTSATTGCIDGAVVDGNRNPVAGVKVTVAGPAGTATVTIKADGRFFFGVGKSGSYTVSLDPATLPSGLEAHPSSRTVDAVLDQLRPAGFVLTGHGVGSGSRSAASTSRLKLFWDDLSQGVLFGLLLALAAIGLSLIYGTTGLSNFAHSEQITLGGFLSYIFAVQIGLNFIVSTVIVVVLAGLSGFIQDFVLWAPLRRRGLGLNQLMIVTIGLSLALEYVYAFFFGEQNNHPVSTILQKNVGPLDITPAAYWSMLACVLVLGAVGLALMFTRIGRAMRAVSDNPGLALASGINVDWIIRLVWISSTALAGLSGVLYGLVTGPVGWLTGAQLLLLVFAAVTLGGIGTAFGALVGSLIIGIVANVSTLWIPNDLKYGTGLVILILVLLVRPQGIFGVRDRVG